MLIGIVALVEAVALVGPAIVRLAIFGPAIVGLLPVSWQLPLSGLFPFSWLLL